MNNTLSTIGLCKRAGVLLSGFDVVKEAMEMQVSQVVVLASDISPKTQKEAIYYATKYNRAIIQIDSTIEEMWSALGKRVAVVAILDKGFANKFKKLYPDLKENIE